MSIISIAGLDKAEVFRVLYNRAQTQGMGLFHFRPGDMPIEEARKIVKTQTYFDYVQGRVMKVEIKGDELFTGAYDRDNGHGAAERAIATLRVQA